ncbi:MAG: hypothetical protein L0216_13590 [Planctomycetales bacterium]|nr:hypothetical protein [Planctomycetales bacterium]
MALVVFLRAANVGGHALRPKALADDLGLVNIGAAGTFVATGKTAPRRLAAAIRRRIPYETAVMVCPAAEVLRLVRSDPFGARPPAANVKRFVSILEREPRSPPKLPIERPDGGPWEVRVVRLVGRYALSLSLRRPGGLYPNEVVEKSLGVPATTRGWETVLEVARRLAAAG